MKAETEKLAVALGWIKADRNGVEVWCDPEGGHVLPHELESYLNAKLDALIAEACEPLPDDMIALMKRGNPFTDPSKN